MAEEIAGAGCEELAAQGKQLSQLSKTTNQRKPETVKPRQTVWLWGASKAPCRPDSISPQTGETAALHFSNAAVTPKQLCHGSHRKAKVANCPQRTLLNFVELPAGAMAGGS